MSQSQPSQNRSGTLALSWGAYGGFYANRNRVCLGRLALTRLPIEIDDLMRTYADTNFSEVCWNGSHDLCMLPGCACHCHPSRDS